jgi:hypothetical protein
MRRANIGKARKHRPRPPTYVCVPATFDPHAILPSELRHYADCARYFLHRIIWGKVMRRLTLDNYVPIKFAYLRAVIPDRVIRPLKVALEEAEIIECDNHYIEGVKALAYRLGPRYRNARFVRVAIGDQATADKLRANREAEHKKVKLDVHKYLRNWYRRLEIDLPLALRLLNGHPRYELVKVPAEQIAGKDFSFSVCPYGRVHTDLTQCSRRIRPALRMNGQSLVSIDVANSQPLFLALVLINYRKHGHKKFSFVTFNEEKVNPYADIDTIIQTTILPFPEKGEEQTTPATTPSITNRIETGGKAECRSTSAVTTTSGDSGRLAVNRQFLKPDEVKFLALCEAGKLYEDFMVRLEIPVRDWVKDRFFEYAYGRNHFQSPFKADFTEVFPNVAEMIRLLKRRDYTFLPCLMQNIEANFIINTVCRRLMNEFPESPVLTIHDCLLTTPPHLDTIQRVMREEFRRLGLAPTFHVKRYGLPDADGLQSVPDVPEMNRNKAGGPQVI